MRTDRRRCRGPARRRRRRAKGLELVAVIESSVPAVVSGDPGRVRQVLTNLIGNAIKFTQTGEIVVRVTEAEAGIATETPSSASRSPTPVTASRPTSSARSSSRSSRPTPRRRGSTAAPVSASPSAASSSRSWAATAACRAGSERAAPSGSRSRVHADAGQVRARTRSPDADLAGVTALVVDDNATQRERPVRVPDRLGHGRHAPPTPARPRWRPCGRPPPRADRSPWPSSTGRCPGWTGWS